MTEAYAETDTGPEDVSVELPNDATLRDGIAALLGATALTVVERAPSIRASTFPAEIVVCRTGDGRELRLYCKYAHGGGSLAHGHRGGVSYEAAIYRDVLAPLGVTTPRFLGSWTAPGSRDVCLVLDYIDNSVRLNRTPDPDDALSLAARWLAVFHRDAAPAARTIAALKRYDEAYYLGWAERAQALAGRLLLDLPWFAATSRGYAELVEALLADSATLVHGEFYPANVIVRDGSLYVVDWESAAVASGAIDLVSLSHEWPDDVVAACQAEYCRARFSDVAPPGWDDAVAAARLYWEFRWLGDEPAPPPAVAVRGFEQLRALGEELDL